MFSIHSPRCVLPLMKISILIWLLYGNHFGRHGFFSKRLHNQWYGKLIFGRWNRPPALITKKTSEYFCSFANLCWWNVFGKQWWTVRRSTSTIQQIRISRMESFTSNNTDGRHNSYLQCLGDGIAACLSVSPFLLIFSLQIFVVHAFAEIIIRCVNIARISCNAHVRVWCVQFLNRISFWPYKFRSPLVQQNVPEWPAPRNYSDGRVNWLEEKKFSFMNLRWILLFATNARLWGDCGSFDFMRNILNF